MKVKFLYNEENADLFAVFPTEIVKNIFGKFMSCYSTIGQHSLCSEDYIKESREVEPEYYFPLLNELKTIYTNIEII
jgi:hypothetical protein